MCGQDLSQASLWIACRNVIKGGKHLALGDLLV